MVLTRLLRRGALVRHSNLAVFVFPDEATVFQAYRLLQLNNISPEHLAIVGEGYSSPERVGLLEPIQIAIARSWYAALFSGFLGVLGSFLVFLVFRPGYLAASHVNLFWAIPVLGIMSGFCGAVVGGLIGFFGEGCTAGIYHHHLRMGRYLLMMEGSEKLVQQGREIVSQYAIPRLR